MNIKFLDNYDLPDPQRRAAIELLDGISSAEVRHPVKGQGPLVLTVRGVPGYEWNKVVIGLDGAVETIDERMRHASVFDDVEDPEDPEEIVYPDPPDPFDPQNWDDEPETVTDLVVFEKEDTDVEEIDPISDILFGAATPMPQKVAVLVNICAGVVGRQLKAADEELSPALLKAEELRGTLNLLGRLRAVTNVAEFEVAMKMDELNTRYTMADGGSADLAEELRRAMPVGNISAGRAYKIAQFLTEGSRILLTAGIKPEEIAVILQDGQLSRLAVVSSAVIRISGDVTLNADAKLVAYRKVLSDAVTMSVRKLQREYGKHHFPNVAAYMQRDGSWLRVVMQISSMEQWDRQIGPRLTMLDFDTGFTDKSVTPEMALRGDLAEIFETAVMSAKPRQAVLGVLSHVDGPCTRVHIASILIDLSENQVAAILTDLKRWSLVEEHKIGNQTVYQLARGSDDAEQ